MPGMSEKSGIAAERFLSDMGVNIIKNCRVTDVSDNAVTLSDGRVITTRKVIWAAGITGNTLKGLERATMMSGNRYKVNTRHKIEGYDHIYALGDIACMVNESYPNGHPQVAQVALQQANNLANLLSGKKQLDFKYKDKGSMATIGKNKAVVDLPFLKLQGFIAWVIWMSLHLMLILSVRNKLIIFINWAWAYLTKDTSLRLILMRDQNQK